MKLLGLLIKLTRSPSAYSTRYHSRPLKTPFIEWIRLWNEGWIHAQIGCWKTYLTLINTRILLRPVPPVSGEEGEMEMLPFEIELGRLAQTATAIIKDNELDIKDKIRALFMIQDDVYKLQENSIKTCGRKVDKNDQVYNAIQAYLEKKLEGWSGPSSLPADENKPTTFNRSNSNNNNEISNEQIVERWKAMMKQRNRDLEEESKSVVKEIEKPTQPLKDQSSNIVGKKEVISESISKDPKPQKSGGWWDMISNYISENPGKATAIGLLIIAGLGAVGYYVYNCYYSQSPSKSADTNSTVVKDTVKPSTNSETPVDNIIDPVPAALDNQVIEPSWWTFLAENPYCLYVSLVMIFVIATLTCISWNRSRGGG